MKRVGGKIMALIVWSSLTSYGQEVISINSQDTLPVGHYSITLNKNCKAEKLEWYLKWLTKDTGNVQGSIGIEGRYKYNIFTGQPPFHFAMSLTQLALDEDDNLSSLPADKIGDSLLHSTLLNIKNEVALDGGLSLGSIQFTTDSTGEKKFAVLSFMLKKKVPLLATPKPGEVLTQVIWQYVYIPPSTGKKYIVIALYSENLAKTLYSDNYTPRFYDCFREILGTMSYRE